MNKYVDKLESEGVVYASIDRNSDRLVADRVHDDFVSAVELSCNIYNAQAAPLRGLHRGQLHPLMHPRNGGPETNGDDGGGRPKDTPTSPGDTPPPPGGCVSSASVRFDWWGFEVYLNHCAVNDLQFIEGGSSAVLTAIALWLAGNPVSAIVLGAIAASIALNLAWLTWADNHCSGRGAYLEEPWIALGSSWVRPVC